MQKYTDVVFNTTGDPIANVNVTVTVTGGPAATLYADNGVTQLSGNVVTTDSLGRFSFYAANGRYTLSLSGANIASNNLTDVILHDPADVFKGVINKELRNLGLLCSGEATARWQLLATLPPSSAATYDHTVIEAVFGGWDATTKTHAKVKAGNRNTFTMSWEGSGAAPTANAGIQAYSQPDGSVNIYAYVAASTYSALSASVTLPNGATTVYSDPITSVPGGTLVFDTATTAPRTLVNGDVLLLNKTAVTANGGDMQVSRGLTFPSAQVACTDPNTLDDYREGTFTPVLSGTTAAGAGTYTIQEGSYTKIGRSVYFRLRVTITAHTGTGNLRVDGLPLAAAAAIPSWACAIFADSLAFTGQLVAQVLGGTTQIKLSQLASDVAPTEVAMDTACTLEISGHYHV